MTKNTDPVPGSPEDLEAKGLVPTMWQIMDAARHESPNDPATVEPPKAAGETNPATPKKEKSTNDQ